MNTRFSAAVFGLSASLFALSVAVGSNAAPAAAPAPVAAPAGDAAKGAMLFLQCRACHTVTVAGRNGVGPNLAGVIGMKAASHPGFNYSPALAKSGVTWNAATLDTWLKRPAAMVPGTKMVFGGVADPKARANLIAYLATQKAQ